MTNAYKRAPRTEWRPTPLKCTNCNNPLQQKLNVKTSQALEIRCQHGCYYVDLEEEAHERSERLRKETAQAKQIETLRQKARDNGPSPQGALRQLPRPQHDG